MAIKCDRCGREFSLDKSEVISFEVDRAFQEGEHYDLCPDCKKKLIKIIEKTRENFVKGKIKLA